MKSRNNAASRSPSAGSVDHGEEQDGNRFIMDEDREYYDDYDEEAEEDCGSLNDRDEDEEGDYYDEHYN